MAVSSITKLIIFFKEFILQFKELIPAPVNSNLNWHFQCTHVAYPQSRMMTANDHHYKQLNLHISLLHLNKIKNITIRAYN